MPSGRLPHTLLPKVLALPIFASDALSSVAYSVEGGLVILVAASANYQGLILPLNAAVVLLMLIVVASYRQVVRAYPTSAGSYVVSRENLGVWYGLVAAAALLVDYVMTVAVSVSSGVLALIAVFPSLASVRLWLCFAIVGLLVAVNLRGLREAGLVFALPTYVFIASMLIMIASGIAECVHGCPRVAAVPDPVPVGTASTVGLFVILHSFSTGSSALTGTESIANGVSAFRRPQGRNAAAVLSMLGGIAVVLILGTAYLAYRTGAHPSAGGKVSVVSEIARAVFDRAGHGMGAMFFILQLFTLAILVLASNTSFQGFPRLSALLAQDSHLPGGFRNLGDRLVYSNGILTLGALAGLMIALFDANVDRLLQLYVVGVFVAFTLSQAGMVVYWRRAVRRGGPDAGGWRHRIAINGVGAVATGLVLAIVIATKLLDGAWIVIVAVPFLVYGFHRVRRHYERVAAELAAAPSILPSRDASGPIVIRVQDFDAALARAVAFAHAARRAAIVPVHVAHPADGPDPAEDWARFAPQVDAGLRVLWPGGSPDDTFIRFVRTLRDRTGETITVVIPETIRGGFLLTALRPGGSFRLKLRLLREPGVIVADVPVGAGAGAGPVGPPRRIKALVLISAVNSLTAAAVRYAGTLGAEEVRAVYFADPAQELDPVLSAWQELGLPVPLDVVGAPFRDLRAPVLGEVRRVTADPSAIAAVLVPEVVHAHWWQKPLHGHQALFLKRLLLFEDRVILTSVPYRLS